MAMNSTPHNGQVLWLALRNVPDALEVIGIFPTEVEAMVACERREDVIGPILYGRKLDNIAWSGAYYPLAKEPQP